MTNEEIARHYLGLAEGALRSAAKPEYAGEMARGFLETSLVLALVGQGYATLATKEQK